MERETPSIIKDLVRILAKAIKGEALGEEERLWGEICASMVRGFVNIRWKCENDQPLEEYEKVLRSKIPENSRSLVMALYQDKIKTNGKPYNDDVKSIEALMLEGFAKDFCERIGKVKTASENTRENFIIQTPQMENTSYSMRA